MGNIGRDPWDEQEGRETGKIGRDIGRFEKGWKGRK